MNFSLTNVTMFTVGCILIWAAIKDQDPRTIIQNALQGKATGEDYSKGVGKVPAPGSGQRQKGTDNGTFGAGRGTNGTGGTAV